MRAARKCGPTRARRSMRFSSGRSRRQLRNPRQNQLEKQISTVSPIESKTVFVQVSLQVLRAHVVVDPADTALYQTPESFDGLSVNVARDVNLCAVPDALMNISVLLKAIVRNVVIGEHGARRQDIFLRQTMKSVPCRVRSYTRHNPANALLCVPFRHAHDRNFVAPQRRTPTLPHPLSFPPVVHFVHLNRRALQLQTVLGQETPNLAEHAPRGLIGDASFPLNLLRGDTATSGTHEVHGVEPSLEKSSGFLEHGPRQRIDVIPAVVAGIGGTARHTIMLPLDAALPALGYAIRPALLVNVLKAGIVVRKLGVKVRDGVAQLSGDALLRLHGLPHCLKPTRILTCRQGIIALQKT